MCPSLGPRPSCPLSLVPTPSPMSDVLCLHSGADWAQDGEKETPPPASRSSPDGIWKAKITPKLSALYHSPLEHKGDSDIGSRVGRIKELNTLACPVPLPQPVPRPQGSLGEPAQVGMGRVPGVGRLELLPPPRSSGPQLPTAPLLTMVKHLQAGASCTVLSWLPTHLVPRGNCRAGADFSRRRSSVREGRWPACTGGLVGIPRAG